ncbi:30S ribosomal protein S31, chloroplastic [Amborella trichopoda]|uniref:30S ribosomal protein S31, chloroplastic n=1 Tax=Amborella trichopoda TaxID=13333 RepID=W1PRA1_AMBTC|nr:30S ribosomal protein S31, chloroplastic [Amborella trichopoda]ERN09755.1 hypothetical protein AMTR_s00029p00235620 [Amborella trichopoda]|eukprot:XP_006848174.1 30S ribosomal protein S31, chloroplastic [Amborella trichopoda]
MALTLGAAPMVLNFPSLSSRASLSFKPNFGFSLSNVSPSSSSLSMASTAPLYPSVFCGRGDRKTAKGKRFSHSFGNARPRNKKKGRGPPRVPAPPLPPKKDRFDDGEVVKIQIDESIFSN